MKNTASVYDESVIYTCIKTHCIPSLRPAAIRCAASIFYNFFLRQYIAALLPHRAPVSRVDHPLDQKIPFAPSWVTIYLDFVSFWLRMLAFFLRRYGRRAYGEVRGFIETIRRLYIFAAETYQKNLSTTDRPFYISHPRFLLIHLLDPHLMCVPSLHVMVVCLTYTKFAAMLRALGEADNCRAQMEEMKQGALAITQAILFVKQHSVNCIPASLYAMTRFDSALFPPEEAEAFTNMLFGEAPAPPEQADRVIPNLKMRPSSAPRTKLPAEDIAEIKAHIISLYRRFLAEGETAQRWEEPLLRFMRQMPGK
jgi:hypothetical protein